MITEEPHRNNWWANRLTFHGHDFKALLALAPVTLAVGVLTVSGSAQPPASANVDVAPVASATSTTGGTTTSTTGGTTTSTTGGTTTSTTGGTTTSTTGGTTTSTSVEATTTTTTAPSVTVASGTYVDAAAAPGYVMTVNSTSNGFVGWLYFVYQEGTTSEVFHYSGHVSADGTLTVQTDTAAQAFSIGSAPPFPQAGSTPIPAGNVFSGTYSQNTIVLPNCGSYLYWATSAHLSEPLSCSFSLASSS
jgi:hypothetical protein